jgi:hypothetical protein
MKNIDMMLRVILGPGIRLWDDRPVPLPFRIPPPVVFGTLSAVPDGAPEPTVSEPDNTLPTI